MPNSTNDATKIAYTEGDILSILETLDSLTIKGYESASKVVNIADIIQNKGQRVSIQPPESERSEISTDIEDTCD